MVYQIKHPQPTASNQGNPPSTSEDFGCDVGFSMGDCGRDQTVESPRPARPTKTLYARRRKRCVVDRKSRRFNWCGWNKVKLRRAEPAEPIGNSGSSVGSVHKDRFSQRRMVVGGHRKSINAKLWGICGDPRSLTASAITMLLSIDIS